MTEKLELELHSRQQAWAIMNSQLFPFLKNALQGNARWVLTVARRKRTRAQNRRYFGRGVLAQIAEQAVVDGKQFSAEIWHEFLKRKFLGVEELPDGSLIAAPSKGLTTAQFSEYCQQCEAYAATELGVTFYDLEDG